jgi:hypothetical protein
MLAQASPGMLFIGLAKLLLDSAKFSYVIDFLGYFKLHKKQSSRLKSTA